MRMGDEGGVMDEGGGVIDEGGGELRGCWMREEG